MNISGATGTCRRGFEGARASRASSEASATTSAAQTQRENDRQSPGSRSEEGPPGPSICGSRAHQAPAIAASAA